MTESLYYEHVGDRSDYIPYGLEVDFGTITALAREHEDAKNYEEAIRVYRELSEVIAEHMDIVDDSDGYYGDCFSGVIHSMANCINRQGVDKKPHITYMFEKFMRRDPDYFADDYEDALYSVCTDADDIKHWENLVDPHIPDTFPHNDKNWSENFEARRLVRMKITILERRKSRMLPDMLAKYYRNDDDICVSYIKHLRKKDKQAALRVAEEGAKTFPYSKKIRNIVHGLYEKTDPRYDMSLRRFFMDDLSWRHYDELKKRSDDWDDELASIIDELEQDKKYYMLIDVLLREHMTDRAVLLILQCNQLALLEEYHNTICKIYPEKCHAAYKKHIDRLARDAHGRSSYKLVKKHLKKMKNVPDHKKEFAEFVEHLKKRHARQPAFLDELKRL